MVVVRLGSSPALHFGKTTLTALLNRTGFEVRQFRTGVKTVFFMESIERVWKHRFSRNLPMKWLIDRAVVRPLSLVAGHLGYGTDMTVYAVKSSARGSSSDTPR